MSYRLEQQVISATVVGPDLCWLFCNLEYTTRCTNPGA